MSLIPSHSWKTSSGKSWVGIRPWSGIRPRRIGVLIRNKKLSFSHQILRKSTSSTYPNSLQQTTHREDLYSVAAIYSFQTMQINKNQAANSQLVSIMENIIDEHKQVSYSREHPRVNSQSKNGKYLLWNLISPID